MIDNRTEMIDELEALRVAPALRRSRDLLIQAMHTSLKSDRKHAKCGSCAARFDHRATAQKQAFIREYQPYLEKQDYKGRLDERDF